MQLLYSSREAALQLMFVSQLVILVTGYQQIQACQHRPALHLLICLMAKYGIACVHMCQHLFT